MKWNSPEMWRDLHPDIKTIRFIPRLEKDSDHEYIISTSQELIEYQKPIYLCELLNFTYPPNPVPSTDQRK